MREETIKLGDARSCEIAILAADIGDPVMLEENYISGGVDVYAAAGNRLGRLTESSWVTQALQNGEVVHHASVNWINDQSDPPSVRIRVAIGEPNERYGPPEPVNRGYPVGVVGESNYQHTIRSCREGQRVQVLHEIGNPYDELALVVMTEAGEKLGYIPKSCWLRDAVHEEAKGCGATILSISAGPNGAGVVIDVELDSDGVEECAYRP